MRFGNVLLWDRGVHAFFKFLGFVQDGDFASTSFR